MYSKISQLSRFWRVEIFTIFGNHLVFSENNGTPKIIHINKVFHYKPSILGYPYFWKQPLGEKTPPTPRIQYRGKMRIFLVGIRIPGRIPGLVVKNPKNIIFPNKVSSGWIRFLVGGFNPILNPFWKICSSNWIIPPRIGVNIKNMWVATT